MKKRLTFGFIAAISFLSLPQPSEACTGITLTAQDSTTIVARTIEWGGSDLNSQYVVVPRGYTAQSYTPEGVNGMKFTSRYGYVGLAVEQKDFVAEGLNEMGLSAGLFYFPRYGKYVDYNPNNKSKTIADLQLVAWLLGECATVDDVMDAVKDVDIVPIDPRASTVHWRFTDPTGRQVVLEIVDGKLQFFENKLGVLTNSPSFEWQMTNLNNYVNLFPGSASTQDFGNIQLNSLGVGSGALGLPGDATPPSRFVRAAFYQTTAPQQPTAEDAVLQGFQIMNNFDLPLGIEFPKGQATVNIPSATQWTSATDMTNRRIYYRTMHNSAIRCINLNKIDFTRTKYKTAPLDNVKRQPIEMVKIK